MGGCGPTDSAVGAGQVKMKGGFYVTPPYSRPLPIMHRFFTRTPVSVNKFLFADTVSANISLFADLLSLIRYHICK